MKLRCEFPLATAMSRSTTAVSSKKFKAKKTTVSTDAEPVEALSPIAHTAPFDYAQGSVRHPELDSGSVPIQNADSYGKLTDKVLYGKAQFL